MKDNHKKNKTKDLITPINSENQTAEFNAFNINQINADVFFVLN